MNNSFKTVIDFSSTPKNVKIDHQLNKTKNLFLNNVSLDSNKFNKTTDINIEFKLNSNKHILDHGLRCWLVVFSCAFINAVLFGIYRSYALLYTILINTYNLNRTEASWPFSLCMTTIHLTGPFSALLSSKVTIRKIYFVGCFLSTLGIGLCYFANSITTISIYIGIIQGLGIGLVYVQSVAILSEYFSKRIGVANSISMSGGTFGAFLVAPLLEFSLKNYQLKGSYIMLTFLTMLTIPCTIILKNNKLSSCKIDKMNKQTSLRRNFFYLNKKFSKIYSKLFNLNKKSYNLDSTCTFNEANPNLVEVTPKNNNIKSFNSSFCNCNLQKHSFKNNNNLFPVFTINSPSKQYSPYSKEEFDLNSSFYKKLFLSIKHTIRTILFKIKKSNQFQHGLSIKSKSKKSCSFKYLSIILSNLHFWLIMSTHLAYFWSIITYSMVIVDYSIDCGIARSLANNMITSFSLGDFLGRLSLGWIVDKKLLPTKNLYIINIFLIGIFLNISKYIFTYYDLMLVTFLLGILSGSIIVLVNVCYCEYLGKKHASLGFGLSSFFCGLSTINRPNIVGYYRDIKGSYTNLFSLLSLLCFIATFLWLIESFINMLKRKNKLNNQL